MTSAEGRVKLRKYFRSSLSLALHASMALNAQDILQKATEEAKNILGAVPGIAAEGAALYVKEGTPSGVIPNVGVALARQACRRYADSGAGLPGGVAAGFERVCRPYLDDIGYGVGPVLKPPFEGGQCSGSYVIWGQLGGQDQQIGGLTPRNATGPLSSAGRREVAAPGDPFPTSMRTFFDFNTPGGLVTVGVAWDASFPQSRSVRVERIGAADDCGNPPPEVTQPTAPAPPPGPTEPYNPSPDIDIDIDVDIGPQGNITFNIGVNPVTIDPFGGGGGGGGGGDNPGIDQPGTAPSSGLPPGDIGQPAAPEQTDPQGNAAGCGPPNSVLVGLKINILSSPPFGSEYDPLVRRGVCYAYMGTLGNLALEPSGVALRSGQMLFAPLDNLTCWEVRANTGYVLQVIPYYRALELTEV